MRLGDNEYTFEELILLLDKHRDDPVKFRKLVKLYPRLARVVSIGIDNIYGHDLKINGEQILSYMGYSKNEIYSSELHHAIDYLHKGRYMWHPNGNPFGYSNVTTALCIITEILDYYNSKYNEIELLDTYDIDINMYLDLKIKFNRWFTHNYWKPKILIN